MNEEKYEEFVSLTCELLGLNKPIDVLKLCQLTSNFIRPYEMKIKVLEKENSNLLQQIERMKCCYNCAHFKEYSDYPDIYYACELKECDNLDRWEQAE